MDAAWNVVSGSKTYDNYTVYNMLEKITWTSWSYNTTNYDTASSSSYIAPRETTLTLSDIYTVPNNASVDTYKWYSTGNNVETINTSPTATLNGNSIYYVWFDRDRYTLDLIINTWVNIIYYMINGATSYTSTQSTTENIIVKAWSQISAYAEAKSGYTYTETSSINPWSVTVIWDNVFSPIATANTNTQYIVYHYVKRVWSGTYALSKTETKYGTSDEVLILSSLANTTEFLCAHYDRWSLTWTEWWPWDIVTETTINWDGSTEIYLYYVRDYYNVTLSGDEHVQSLEWDGVRECWSDVPVNAIPKTWYHFVRWDREEREKTEEDEEPETPWGW